LTGAFFIGIIYLNHWRKGNEMNCEKYKNPDLSYEYWRSIEILAMEEFLQDVSYEIRGFYQSVAGKWFWTMPVGYYIDVKRSFFKTPLYWK
jgi:hypothetical protein